MDYIFGQSPTSEAAGSSASVDLSNLSPVTNLALNLSSLSTSVAGTPIRRISWSNPVPGGDKIGVNFDDISPSMTDSPVHEILSKSKLSKHKNIFENRIDLLLKYEEKENICPRSSTDSIKNEGETEFFLEKCSQDSGYSGSSTSHRWRGKSFFSSFDVDEDSMDIFAFDGSESPQENFPLPNNMSSLLRKPLAPLTSSEVTPGSKKSNCAFPRWLSAELNTLPSLKFPTYTENVSEPLTDKDPNDPGGKDNNMSSLLRKPLVPLTSCEVTPGSKKSKHALQRWPSAELNTLPSLKFPTYTENVSKTLTDKDPNDTGGKVNGPNDYSVLQGKSTFKRPEPPNNLDLNECKRRKSSPSIDFPFSLPSRNIRIQRSYSETAATIMHAILKSDLQPELIGDGSRVYALPLVKGRHQDLKSISPETLARLLQGEFKEEINTFVIIDCRYPYEFEGGHIQGAKNIYTKDDILETFFTISGKYAKKTIIIFHCEFSSERAPSLCRFLRKKDREINQGNYPRLDYPEMYILEGGYKAFYKDHKELCVPQDYKPMNHKDHGFEMRHFRAKSKSWGSDSKNRGQLRSNSITSIL